MGTDEQCRSFTHLDAGPSPKHRIVSAPHVASLAQSMVSAPMVRASPGAWSQNLWSCQSNSFECMRYGSASDVWIAPALSMRSGPELDVLKPGPNSFILRLRRRVDQRQPPSRAALRGSKPTLEGRKTKEKLHYGSFTNGTAGPSPT